MKPEKRIRTAKELAGYRQWLAELDEEARLPGGDLSDCDKALWQYFSPKTAIGRQVYESFSDGELLDILLRTMQQQGHTPRFDEVYCVYKRYLITRFGDLNEAKMRARARRKRLELLERWPPDWASRVSAEPLLALLAQWDCALPEEDAAYLRRICDDVRRTGLPPELTADDRRRLDKLCGCRRALETMGIPFVPKNVRRSMEAYWKRAHRKNMIQQNNLSTDGEKGEHNDTMETKRA